MSYERTYNNANQILSNCSVTTAVSNYRKYHKLMKNIGAINLSDGEHKSQTQVFIEAYKHLKSQGALDEGKIMEVAQDIVRDKMKERFEGQKESIGLVDSFTEASRERKTSQTMVDVKSIFES